MQRATSRGQRPHPQRYEQSSNSGHREGSTAKQSPRSKVDPWIRAGAPGRASSESKLAEQRELGALELTVETGVDVLEVVDAGVEVELTLVEDDVGLRRDDEAKADTRLV